MHDDARIMFMDEYHFYHHGTRIRMLFPPEDRDPVVYQEPNRKGITVFGAVSLDSGRLLTSLTDRYNALTFLEFLSSAHRAFPDSIFVLDNALYHQCRRDKRLCQPDRHKALLSATIFAGSKFNRAGVEVHKEEGDP